MRIVVPPATLEWIKRLYPDASSEPISHSILNRTIENAQRTIEGQHFDIRKQLLEYDNVANDQRTVVYSCRDQILKITHPSDLLKSYLVETLQFLLKRFFGSGAKEFWDLEGIIDFLGQEYRIAVPPTIIHTQQDVAGCLDALSDYLLSIYHQRTEQIDKTNLTKFERSVIIHHFDQLWREHLIKLDMIRQNVSLRGYAQKDPKQEYKLEAFALFEEMMLRLAIHVTDSFLKAQFVSEEESSAAQEDATGKSSVEGTRISRNEHCPCASGKKYKHCCGKISEKN